jgi:hypothetical protein
LPYTLLDLKINSKNEKRFDHQVGHDQQDDRGNKLALTHIGIACWAKNLSKMLLFATNLHGL